MSSPIVPSAISKHLPRRVGIGQPVVELKIFCEVDVFSGGDQLDIVERWRVRSLMDRLHEPHRDQERTNGRHRESSGPDHPPITNWPRIERLNTRVLEPPRDGRIELFDAAVQEPLGSGREPFIVLIELRVHGQCAPKSCRSVRTARK